MSPTQRVWPFMALAFALSAMAVVAAMAQRSISGFVARAESVEHSYRVLLGLQEALSSLRDAESGHRGYLLTRDSAQLDHYHEALERAAESVLELRTLTDEHSAQRARLGQLEALLDERRRLLDSGIETARGSEDFGEAAAWVRDGGGTRNMDEIRALAARMIEHESQQLSQRAAEFGASARRATAVLVIGSILSIILLLVAFDYLRREIGRRARAEAALRRNRDEMEDLYNNAPCGYHSLDADGVFVRINDTELSWLGYTREELVGHRTFTDLLAPDSLATFARNFPKFKESGRIDDVEFTLHRKDGSELQVSLSATALRDADGSFLMSRSTMFDITERKRAERRIAELNRDLERHASVLEQANRELESFSYSVSHDLRSPLRAIDGFSRLLEEDYGDRLDAEGRRLLAVVRDNSLAMSRLIDDLLAFSRLGRRPITPASVDMQELAAQSFEEVLEADGTTRPRLVARPMPAGQGDATLLKQVWLNLMSNAVKFSSGRERPEVEIGGRIDGGENVYFVRDNGAGFDMRYYDKLFGVFQRLHRQDEFKGTGVGLAIVHRVVTRHGGRVWAESELDGGAIFYFSLPNVEQAS